MLLTLQTDLPVGPAPPPVSADHFPDRLHAYVWRNWPLVPTSRIASAIDAAPSQIISLGKSMGLQEPPLISQDQQLRSALTVIRRNWHLLPYEQLLKLLGWTPEHLAYTLREDDFLYIKLGSLKPKCEPIHYTTPTSAIRKREHEIAAVVHREFPKGLPFANLFGFVKELSTREVDNKLPESADLAANAALSPRFCYSYFALYGDPLLDTHADPYPEAYLQRLHDSGVDGVWLQGVLPKLAPFPWDWHQSDRYEQRLTHLRSLVARAQRHKIGVYIYLNEPRAMPLSFFSAHPELEGVVEGDHAALCTSVPAVQEYITASIASICCRVPNLAGFFTITASENLTNCWSHGAGKSCPRCGARGAAQVIAEVNSLIQQGIRRAGSKTELIAWDWGWPESTAEVTIRLLPSGSSLMSVSEWDLPISRGGVDTTVGEYSLSAVGPGPRAKRHWKIARSRGLRTIAKIQAANSWEMSAVPYVPAIANAAQHAANLRAESLNGLMLGWTLGGYPSPNLEVVAQVSAGASPDAAMLAVATKRYGADAARAVVSAWKVFSGAFSEFPFNIGTVYTAPLQHGPANLLWGEPTGYHATMVGYAYDDLDGWRSVYPPEIFASQLYKTADGFMAALDKLKATATARSGALPERKRLELEMGLAETVAIHYLSVANQSMFILHRAELLKGQVDHVKEHADATEKILNDEIALAHRLIELQANDPRIGFEASNQYYYVGVDLMEKILNCEDLRDRWLPWIGRGQWARRQ